MPLRYLGQHTLHHMRLLSLVPLHQLRQLGLVQSIASHPGNHFFHNRLVLRLRLGASRHHFISHDHELRLLLVVEVQVMGVTLFS